jgi:hypothetical protein
MTFDRSKARRPEKNAGVRGPCGRKHVFFLIFLLVTFLLIKQKKSDNLACLGTMTYGL